jgi:DNA-binding NarL/FixJ family response regulator/tetratricopeptide (TPR) repeat protein
MAQRIGDTWTLTKGAEKLVPAAVRTLITRRAARLPDETTAALAVAAVLGRRFSLKDLKEVEARVGDRAPSPDELADALAPAVARGLLLEHAEDEAADYSFAHEQVREFASGSIPSSRRREIHAAIVELLLAGDPAPESLPLLAHHAKAAGDAFVCVKFSLQAAENALRANAPEEVLRLVDLALPSASNAQERLQLLLARDDALDMLHRTGDRLEALAEIEALAEALGDVKDRDVRLRRAAALRQAEEREAAAELARQVREDAAANGERELELAATLELGQALLNAGLGETFAPSAVEADLEGAGEAFRHAVELARELGDDHALAASLREVAVVNIGQYRAWFVEQIASGGYQEFLRKATSMPLADVIRETPVEPNYTEAGRLLPEALAIYERLGDRQGVMTVIIAMSVLNWGADIHLGRGAGHHIEEIRRLWSNIKAFTKGSERAISEWQMVYGTHVFARAKVIPDLAVSRGEEAYRQAKVLGDRGFEFLSAGGSAMAHLDLDDVAAAQTWLGRAEAAAAEAPTAFRTRQLELWRALVHASAGEADEMRRHFDRACELAAEQGQTAARCEALGRLAVEAARLGEARGDEELLGVAETAALEVRSLATQLPGHPPWPAMANAAMAVVELARGRVEQAAEAGRSSSQSLQAAMHEDMSLETVLPAARAIVEGGTEEEREGVEEYLRLTLVLIAQRIVDPEVRARWFRGSIGGEMTRLAGPIATDGKEGDGESTLDERDVELLEGLVGGRTDREIAEELGVGEAEVASRLAELYARLGTASRAEATAYAFREVI